MLGLCWQNAAFTSTYRFVMREKFKGVGGFVLGLLLLFGFGGFLRDASMGTSSVMIMW